MSKPIQTTEERIAYLEGHAERCMEAMERMTESLPRLVQIISGLSARVEKLQKAINEIAPLTPAAEGQG